MINLNFVNWTDPGQAKILNSTEEVVQAQQSDNVLTTPSGIIINNLAVWYE